MADGYVTRIDEYFKLREVYFPSLGKSVSNYRYGVTLAIARKDGALVNFHYSIEPMTEPGTLGSTSGSFSFRVANG